MSSDHSNTIEGVELDTEDLLDKNTGKDVIVNEISLLVSAEQGKGVNTAGDLIASACAHMGLYVFQNIEYHSNIVGKNSYTRLLLSENPVCSHHDKSDVAILLGADAMVHALDKVKAGGAVIYNTEDTKKHFVPQVEADAALEKIESKDIISYGIPAGTLIRKISNAKEIKPAVLSKMVNIMLVGATYAVLGAEIEMVYKAIDYFFSKKPKLIPSNKEAAKLGFDYIKDNFSSPFPLKIKDITEKIRKDDHRLVMKGTDAMALGAINAGMLFYVYYPITPASDTGDLLDALKYKANILVEQAEDEIAAMSSAVGAGRAGVRAMCGTSGPGFDLKTEALGMAIMNEDPVVILLAQRPGPSTGLPTRGDQSDLLLSLFSSHGGAERIVMMPGDVEEIFYMSQEAFNHADVYQMPVVFVTDKHLMNSAETVAPFDLNRIPIERGQILTQEDFDSGKISDYKRYEFTENGISPRSLPGIEGGQYNSSTDEHTEYGIITDDADNRVAFNNKRFKKLEQADKDISTDNRVEVYGDDGADISVVAWGGTKGPILDGMKLMQKEGYSVNFIQIKYASPFPAKTVREFLDKADRAVIIEENRMSLVSEDGTFVKRGQMETLIRMQTGYTFKRRILKENARPFSMEEIRDYLWQFISDDDLESINGDRV